MTRVVNACVLLEFGPLAVLTDPYLERRWFIRMREPIGVDARRLPRLAAILGSHGVPDHWQPASLESLPEKAVTPVFVATRSMHAKARAAGFAQVERVEWNETRTIAGELVLEVVPAQTSGGLRANNYVLSWRGVRLFFGGEARDLEPLRRYRAERPAIDLVLVPIDGSRLMGRPLVMDGRAAIEATRILGATTLVPIHYAMKPVPPLLETPFSEGDLVLASEEAPDITVVRLETGQRWRFERRTR